jgi:hypothetical protein
MKALHSTESEFILATILPKTENRGTSSICSYFVTELTCFRKAAARLHGTVLDQYFLSHLPNLLLQCTVMEKYFSYTGYIFLKKMNI